MLITVVLGVVSIVSELLPVLLLMETLLLLLTVSQDLPSDLTPVPLTPLIPTFS